MGVVDLDADIPSSEYETQPVVWLDCPGCGKGLKSTWLLKEDAPHCTTCGTTVRFCVVSHFEVLVHVDAVYAAEQRVKKRGSIQFPCQGCSKSLDINDVLRDREYQCGNCGTHHHLEVVFEDVGEPAREQVELCLLCRETVDIDLMDTHHISYTPEKVVRVCRGCHRRIHQEQGYYDELEPETTPKASVSDLMSHPG